MAALSDLPEDVRSAIASGGRPFRDGPSALGGARWLAADAAAAVPPLRALVGAAPAGRG